MAWNPFARAQNKPDSRRVRELEDRVGVLEDQLESLSSRFVRWSAKQRMRQVREGSPDADDSPAVGSPSAPSAPVDSGQDRSTLREQLRARARARGLTA